MIRRLAESDLDAYLALRRQSLLESPLSFAASPEDDFVRSIDAARAQTLFGAFDDDTLVGVVGILRETKLKSAHKVHVWGMYVVPEARGHGHGAALLEAAISHARTLPGVAWISLTVTDAAPAARRLYERAGFQLWGTQPDALRHAGQSVADDHMRLPLAEDRREASGGPVRPAALREEA